MSSSLQELPLPVRIVSAAPVSDDEFLAFARANERCRVEKNAQGEIILMTPVGHRGGQRENYVSSELVRWANAEEQGDANGPNAAVNLPDGSTLSPDAYWVSNQRLSSFTPAQLEKFLPLCPDFIVEGRSQSDSMKDQQAKMEQWLANGAQLAWLIDPFGQTLSIYRPSRAVEVLARPEFVEGEGPVAGFRLSMEELWA